MCPYCDFNSHVRETINTDAMAAAYCTELKHFAGLTGRRPVETIFFGGGTPSLMPEGLVGRILNTIADLWQLGPDAEITLEANPTSADAARFAGYRAAGVNRLSLGVQALDDAALAFLGRQHSAAESLRALDLAAREFSRTSIDLIYGRQNQTPDAWEKELTQALGLPVQHISLYQLTIEKGTAFFQDARDGRLHLPDEDTLRTFFDMTQAITNATGMPAYEVSNHAIPGEECRHNLAYWTYRPYVGVGPGAHGRLPVSNGSGVGRLATRQHAKPETWIDAVRIKGHGGAESEPVPADEMVIEALMMGLRLTDGIDANTFQQATGRPLDSACPASSTKRLIDAEFIERTPTHLCLTAKGRPFLDAILKKLVA
ncbi:MAG: coproporphyrinogen III oxidase [Alphaproteobacteria bacterium]|jgi:oxygen-independent coproporphyrinogen-3 oxidase|nr:coproporphyrinogen III oxidase [Alphaproteobacteria bacterium]